MFDYSSWYNGVRLSTVDSRSKHGVILSFMLDFLNLAISLFFLSALEMTRLVRKGAQWLQCCCLGSLIQGTHLHSQEVRFTCNPSSYDKSQGWGRENPWEFTVRLSVCSIKWETLSQIRWETMPIVVLWTPHVSWYKYNLPSTVVDIPGSLHWRN